MTLVLLASICAYVVGYGLILIADSAGYWQACFYFMILMTVPFILWILAIPNMYLDPLLAPDKMPEDQAVIENASSPGTLRSKPKIENLSASANDSSDDEEQTERENAA